MLPFRQARFLCFLGFFLWFGSACDDAELKSEPKPSETTGAPTVALVPEPALAASLQQCPLRLLLKGPKAPLASHPVSIRAMKQMNERSWRALWTKEVMSDERGEVSVQFPCDMRLSLSSSGWMWANQPDRVVVRRGMEPLRVQLLPELTVRLYVHGGDGPKPKNVRFHRPGDEIGEPVPHQGLMIEGLRMSEVAGEIRSSNLPPRSWRPARSDQLEQLQPGLLDAVVVLGDIQRSWLQLTDELNAQVEGVLCLEDGKRGSKCTFYQGVWRCPCGPPATLGIYGKGWDVGFTRPLPGPDLLLDSLPKSETLCFALPQVKEAGARLVAQPKGVDGGLLLGGMPKAVLPGKETCFRLPQGEWIELSLSGASRGSWTLRSEGQGTQELFSD